MDVGSPSQAEGPAQRETEWLFLRKLQPPRSDEASLLATAMVLRAFHSRLSRASMVKSCRRARGLKPLDLNSMPSSVLEFCLTVQGLHPFVGLHVSLHRFPERCALPPAALGADYKVQAGWMRGVGPALNVDVLCGQEVECGAYARGRRGHAGAGDDPGGVDVFLEPWREIWGMMSSGSSGSAKRGSRWISASFDRTMTSFGCCSSHF